MPATQRIALAVFPVVDEVSLVRSVGRLRPALRSRFAEIFGFRFATAPPATVGPGEAAETAEPPKAETPAVRSFVEPRDSGWGGNLKVVLAYAQERGFDSLILAHPDRVTDQDLAPFLATADDSVEVLLGVCAATAHRYRLQTRLVNWLLGLHLDAMRHPVRRIPVPRLASLSYRSNADGPLFDLELLIQLRAARATLREVPLPEGEAFHPEPSPALAPAWTAVRYRLHQLHLRRYRQFVCQPPLGYTLKTSPFSSHSIIVGLIEPGSRVLDLGCSQGLLAQPLREKGVRVTGVDVIPPEFVSRLLASYHRHDIRRLEDLELGREFHYVVASDVLEHVTTATQTLREVRRFLLPEGRLIASTGNVAIWFYRLSLLLGRFEYGPRGILDGTHVHLYTRTSFRRLIESSGFRVVAEHWSGLPFEVVFESTGQSRLLHLVAASYQLLVRMWPSLFAYQTILEAEIASLEQARGEGLVPDAD